MIMTNLPTAGFVKAGEDELRQSIPSGIGSLVTETGEEPRIERGMTKVGFCN
jgi:hypothetical protein